MKSKIALVQLKAGNDGENNRMRGLKAVDEAALNGAWNVCFAELAFERFYPQTEVAPEELAWPPAAVLPQVAGEIFARS